MRMPPRASISARSRGIVQLGRSATGAPSNGVTTRKAASLFTGGGPGATLVFKVSQIATSASVLKKQGEVQVSLCVIKSLVLIADHWPLTQPPTNTMIAITATSMLGNFKNGGTDYRPKGDPRRVNVHDFEDKKLGRVVPYGVYDVTANAGFVSVGITSDTAEFAVASMRCWLERMGRQRYPQARELTITADCGGSNGARVRLWKLELQKLADETGLAIHVHHYPPGTSKWNRIEHRLFCHITQNWRGRPLTDRLAVVELIGATTTNAGLKVESALDTRCYQKGIKVSNAAMKRLDITGDQFHPEWNYTIKPRPP
jgi:hypothetical protein